MTSSFRTLALSLAACTLVTAASCGSDEDSGDAGKRDQGGAAGAAGENPLGGTAGTAGVGGRAGGTGGTSTGGTGDRGGAGGEDDGGVGGASAGQSGQAGAGHSGEGGEGGGDPQPECDEGERRCVELVPELCDANGRWRVDGPACEYVCRAGTCTGGCVPASTQCASETERQTCDEDGEWGASEACTYACIGGACGGSCVPGERRCLDKTRQQCSSVGEWENDGAACPYVCSAGACTGTCVPDETQCISSTERQTCVGGAWGAPVECQYACVAGACGGVCRPGDIECVAGSPSTERWSCGSDGEWDAPTACTYVCSGDGECTGECVPDTRGCDENTPRECTQSGTWQNETPCSGETPVCSGEGDCGCSLGAVRCVAQQPEHCVAGEWVSNGPVCTSSETCNPVTGACDSCEPFLCGDRSMVVWQVVGPPGEIIDLVTDASGNTYVSGATDPGFVPYLAKYDANGVLLWDKQGAAAGSFWERLAVDANGNLWAGGPAGYIGRFAPDGTQIGVGVYHNTDDIWDIKLDAAGNVYVAGSVPRCCEGPPRRPFVAKYSPSLVELWSRTHTLNGVGFGVAIDSMGNVFLVGSIDVPQTGVRTSSQLLVQRFNSAGTQLSNSVTGTCSGGAGFYIIARAATLDAAGNLYVGGGSCLLDALAEKWSNAGSRLWKSDVTLSGGNVLTRDIDFRASGNTIAIAGLGEAYSHSPAGQHLWTRRYTMASVTIVASGRIGADDIVAGGKYYSPNGGTQILARLRLPADP